MAVNFRNERLQLAIYMFRYTGIAFAVSACSSLFACLANKQLHALAPRANISLHAGITASWPGSHQLRYQHSRALPLEPRHPTVPRKSRVEDLPESQLWNHLASAVGTGQHISDVTAVARAAKADGGSKVAVEALASLGSSGRRPQNEERDWDNWTRGLHGTRLHEPYTITLDLQDAFSEDLLPTQVPMLLPHVLLSEVHRAGRQQFTQSFLGEHTAEQVRDFWDSASRCPEWQGHPALMDSTIAREKLIPITIHFDGAEFYRNCEYNVWSMSSPLSKAQPIDSRFVLLVLPEHHMAGRGVREAVHAAVAKVVAWSLAAAMAGIGPPAGAYGEPLQGENAKLAGQCLAQGWRMCFFGTNADAKARVQMHLFSRHYQCTFVCEGCFACKESLKVPLQLHFADFSAAAVWRETLLSHTGYMMHPPVSPWSQVPGFHLGNCFRDLMHTIYLGWGRDLIASIICDMREFNQLPGGITQLYRQLRTWQVGGRPRYRWTETNTGLNASLTEFPELSTIYKAESVKQFVFFFAHWSKQFPANPHLQLIKMTVHSLAKAIRTADLSGIRFTQEEAEQFHKLGYAFLRGYYKLYVGCQARGVNRYFLRPKHHYFCHILDDALRTRFNPARTGNCTADESYLGVLKKIGSKCHRKTISKRILQRIVVRWALRWRDSRKKGW